MGVTAMILAGAAAVTSEDGTTLASHRSISVPHAATASNATYAERRDRALSRDAERLPLAQEAPAEMRDLVSQRNAAIAEANRLVRARAQELAANRWELPMTGYRLTGRFGNLSSLWSSSHTGLDFAAPTGTPIRSVAPGVVRKAGYAGAYGNQTVVRLADGTDLWYCHQESVSVSVGDRVATGEQIGTVGSTGNVTGPHLHLEVRPEGGDPVDPFVALQQHGVQP